MRPIRVLFCHHGGRLVKAIAGQRNVGIVGEQSYKCAGIVYVVIVKYQVLNAHHLRAIHK